MTEKKSGFFTRGSHARENDKLRECVPFLSYMDPARVAAARIPILLSQPHENRQSRHDADPVALYAALLVPQPHRADPPSPPLTLRLPFDFAQGFGSPG